MNFWKRMRWLGNLALLALVVLAFALEIFASPDTDSLTPSVTQSVTRQPAATPASQTLPRSGTSGL